MRELVQTARRARVLHPDVSTLSLEHVPARVSDQGSVVAEGPSLPEAPGAEAQGARAVSPRRAAPNGALRAGANKTSAISRGSSRCSASSTGT